MQVLMEYGPMVCWVLLRTSFVGNSGLCMRRARSFESTSFPWLISSSSVDLLRGSSLCFTGRPDMTFVVDWALSNNHLSIYLCFTGSQKDGQDKGTPTSLALELRLMLLTLVSTLSVLRLSVCTPGRYLGVWNPHLW